jgi:succinate dehydrogenase hydrophobic anchor subunit
MAKINHSPQKLLWLLRQLSGVTLAGFAVLHLWVVLSKLDRPVLYEDINAMLSQWGWMLFYAFFIFVLVLHGMLTLWRMLTDRNPSNSFKRSLKIILIIAGGVLLLLGEWNLILLGR